MPPRKRAKALGKKTAGGKRAKKADSEETDSSNPPATVHDAMQKLKEADKNKVRKLKPDSLCPQSNQCTVSV